MERYSGFDVGRIRIAGDKTWWEESQEFQRQRRQGIKPGGYEPPHKTPSPDTRGNPAGLPNRGYPFPPKPRDRPSTDPTRSSGPVTWADDPGGENPQPHTPPPSSSGRVPRGPSGRGRRLFDAPPEPPMPN